MREFDKALDKGTLVAMCEAEERADRLEAALRELEAAKKHAEEQSLLLREQAAQLVEAREVAVRAAAAKSEFLATMSHEIRTPINCVIGMMALLASSPLSAEQQDYADTIVRSGEALLRIINEVLDLSRIEAGKMALEPVDFDPHDLVAGVVRLLSGIAADKHLAFGGTIVEGIPRRLCGDSGKLRQILLNLTGNALKFTAAGEVRVLVEPAGDDGAGVRLRFSVTDTGVGITAEDRPKLFLPFTQANDTRPRNCGGTGLGLSISKQLVELMGGELSVESRPGEGSVFSFTVRLMKPAQIVPECRDAGASLPGAAPGGHARILVVEDNLLNRRVASKMLSRLGYQADLASDGYEALEALGRKAYDLVLMDCQMPGLDGFETTAEIRRRESGGRHTAVVAMTANAMQGDRERCLAAGMDDYLSKPIRMAEMSILIRKWQRSQATPEVVA